MALKLPRLPQGQRIADENGAPSLAFTVYWQQVLEALETQEAGQDSLLAQIIAAQNAADAAAADAAAAAAEAQAAQTATKLGDTWTEPGTTLSAQDVGANVTITIAAHERKYGDGTSLSVAGGTITGQPFSTELHVYYVDPTFADTTPTYAATATPNDATNNTATGRHYVGSVTTPANGSGGTTGGSNRPPGYTGTNPLP